METYPEQFPPEGRPDPSHRAEDRVFDANEHGDQPAAANHEGQAASQSPGRRIGETIPVAPDLGGSHLSPRRRPDIPGDTCCFVIAALLFPDIEPDPAIVAEARRSNVHVLWGTDNLMNRLAAIAARKAYYPPNADDIRREVAAVTDGQIAYAEEAPAQPEAQAQPEGPAVPRLEIPAAGITIGHVDTLIVHTGPGPVTDAARDPEPGS